MPANAPARGTYGFQAYARFEWLAQFTFLPANEKAIGAWSAMAAGFPCAKNSLAARSSGDGNTNSRNGDGDSGAHGVGARHRDRYEETRVSRQCQSPGCAHFEGTVNNTRYGVKNSFISGAAAAAPGGLVNCSNSIIVASMLSCWYTVVEPC